MLNKVILTNRLGADPEKTVTPTGKTVVRFSLPLANPFKKENEPTEWMQFEVWNQPAEYLHKYARKGDLIEVEGRLRNQSYEVEGNKRYRTFVSVERVSILHSKNYEGNPKEEKDNNYQGQSKNYSGQSKPSASKNQSSNDELDDVFNDFDIDI